MFNYLQRAFSAQSLLFPVFIISILGLALVSSFATTGVAHAQENETGSCATVGTFTPHIYEDGDLHSFDYVVEDIKTSVSVLETIVSDETLDPRYSTKWSHENGTRIHVEVPSWQGFTGTFEVMVRVKSGFDGSCETGKSFTVTLPEQTYSTPVQPTPAGANAVDGNTDATASADKDATDSNAEGVAGDLATSTPTAGGQCTSFPQFWWIGSVLIHVVIAGAVLFFLRDYIEQSNVWFAIALLVPFVIFLTTWFIYDGCRENQWFPIAIALVSLGTVLSVPDNGKGGRKKKQGGGKIMLMPEAFKKDGK